MDGVREDSGKRQAYLWWWLFWWWRRPPPPPPLAVPLGYPIEYGVNVSLTLYR
ncbi:hypothetical protein AB0K20_03570 [Micromonospora matsumotoense]|uniref:hypothetical protein n=1 Tax=Micromonospora matsumotoense TaxID=121616 RepID=UPI003437DD4E